MKDYSTDHYFQIASELNIPNEWIAPITQIDDCIYFSTKGGTKYSARLTKTGKLKKNSIRLDH